MKRAHVERLEEVADGRWGRSFEAGSGTLCWCARSVPHLAFYLGSVHAYSWAAILLVVIASTVNGTLPFDHNRNSIPPRLASSELTSNGNT
jgi:hypothetical protein